MGHLGILLLGLGMGLLAPRQDEDVKNRIDRFIQTLGDDNKDARDKAVAELAKIGKPALEALRKATSAQDAEVKALAAQAIERIEWGGGLEKLKVHVKERFDDGATVEPSKLKSIARYFPDIRFYEVNVPAGAGPGAMMGGRGGGNLFAVPRYEEGFSRVLVKGVFCSGAFRDLLRTQKIRLTEYDSAFDFGMAFFELTTMSNGQMYIAGANCRFEKVDDGWEFGAQNYGFSVTFKVDKEGLLTEIVQPNIKYWQQGAISQKLGEEKLKLEIEKLKLEVDLLKRQLEKK